MLLHACHISQKLLGSHLGAVELILLHHLLGKHSGISLVNHRESLGKAYAEYLAAQELHAEAMNSAHKIVDICRVGQPSYTCLHLARRLVGERHAEDVVGVDAKLIHEKGIAMHKHKRLARACSRHNLHASLCCLHSNLLFGVEYCW